MVKPSGRKKTRTETIQNQSQLQVTFSKRREGLFTKDNELSILCGGQSATVIFAPNTHNNKTNVYSLGHPSVNSVIDKFLGLNISPDNTDDHADANTYVEQLNEVKELLQQEEARAKMLDEKINARGSFEELNSVQLGELIEKFKFKMEEVERVALQQQECNNIQFPYSTLGDALAP